MNSNVELRLHEKIVWGNKRTQKLGAVHAKSEQSK
jgi:hypothetical protein